MRLSFSLLLSCVLCASSVAAHADTISQTISTGAFSAGPGGYRGNQLTLTGFDPQLGTLTSVGFLFNGQVTAIGGPASASGTTANLSYYIGPTVGQYPQFGGLQQFLTSHDGIFTLSNSYSDSSSSDLQYFSHDGVITPFFSYAQGLLGTDSSIGLNLQVTYNYTAAAPVTTTITPEPSSLVLLGTGVLGFVGISRRRFA